MVTNDQGLIGRVKRHRSPLDPQVLHTGAAARHRGVERDRRTRSVLNLAALARRQNGPPTARGARILRSAPPSVCAAPAVPPGALRQPGRLRRTSGCTASRPLSPQPPSQPGEPPHPPPTQASSRPRETTADRSAAALDLLNHKTGTLTLTLTLTLPLPLPPTLPYPYPSTLRPQP